MFIRLFTGVVLLSTVPTDSGTLSERAASSRKSGAIAKYLGCALAGGLTSYAINHVHKGSLDGKDNELLEGAVGKLRTDCSQDKKARKLLRNSCKDGFETKCHYGKCIQTWKKETARDMSRMKSHYKTVVHNLLEKTRKYHKKEVHALTKGYIGCAHAYCQNWTVIIACKYSKKDVNGGKWSVLNKKHGSDLKSYHSP